MSGFEQGRDMVGKVAAFMVCGWFLLESAKDRFLVLVWFGLLVQVCWSVLLSSVGNNPCPLWATTLVLCGTATLVLCGTAVVLCGTHHPLWLPFRLIGWFGLLVRFWDESLWFLVKVARQPFGSCGLRGNPQSRPTLMN
jgi:hypothetical protein